MTNVIDDVQDATTEDGEALRGRRAAERIIAKLDSLADELAAQTEPNDAAGTLCPRTLELATGEHRPGADGRPHGAAGG